MYNHNKPQQSKNRVHISWDILYTINFVVVDRQIVNIGFWFQELGVTLLR